MQWFSDYVDASGWNTYKGKITDLRSGNRVRQSRIMSGLLDNKNSIFEESMGKLNAHTDASDNLCAYSRIRVTTSRNRWHEIRGTC